MTTVHTGPDLDKIQTSNNFAMTSHKRGVRNCSIHLSKEKKVPFLLLTVHPIKLNHNNIDDNIHLSHYYYNLKSFEHKHINTFWDRKDTL